MNAYLPIEPMDLWHVAAWTMIHYLWLGTLIAAAAIVLRLLMRRAAPSLRYAAALLCLTALAATPPAIAAWLIQNPPASQKFRQPNSPPFQGSRALNPPPFQGGARGGFLGPAQQLTTPNAPKQATRSTLPLEPAATTAPLSAPPAVHARQPLVVFAIQSTVPYLPWLWLLGTPVTFALLALGIVGTKRLKRASAPIDDEPIIALCATLASSLRITRRVALAVCDRIAAPVLIGIVRPIILLPPAALTGWSPDEIEMVLLHELAHVRRWDNLVNLVQRIIESLLFFHPAVWLVSTWARREREACCDALVVALTRRPHAYAELLVNFAAQLQPSPSGRGQDHFEPSPSGRGQGEGALSARPKTLSPPPLTSAMAAGPLRTRIRRILELENDPMLISAKSFTLMLATFLTAATLAVTYLPMISRAQQADPENTDAPADADSAENETKTLAERKAAAQTQNNLKHIALALLNYEATYHHLPPHAHYADGNPMLSWRVLILPFLDHEHAKLYEEFRLDEPWDSEHNRKLIERMPKVFENPSASQPSKTNYLAVVGPEAIFTGTPQKIGLNHVTDGTANTIAVVEADEAVEWTKPQDWEFDRRKPTKGLGNLRANGWYAMFMDGSISRIDNNKPVEEVGIHFTRAGRELRSLKESEGRSNEGQDAFGVMGARGGEMAMGEYGPAPPKNVDETATAGWQAYAVASEADRLQQEINELQKHKRELEQHFAELHAEHDRTKQRLRESGADQQDQVQRLLAEHAKQLQAREQKLEAMSAKIEEALAMRMAARAAMNRANDHPDANQTDSSDKAPTDGLEKALRKKISLVVVLFNDNRGYIRRLRPTYERLTREGKTIYLFGIEIDPASNEAKRYGIGRAATLIVFRDGKETARLQDIEDAEQLSEFVAAKLDSSGKPKDKFPSLEEQKLADLAWKRLQLELESIGEQDLKRVKALGYKGGLKVTNSPHQMSSAHEFEQGDILVGLHIWPTTSLKDVAAVLNRDDLANLTPLKYYVVRPGLPQLGPMRMGMRMGPEEEDTIVTGRISIATPSAPSATKDPRQQTATPPSRLENVSLSELAKAVEAASSQGMEVEVVKDGDGFTILTSRPREPSARPTAEKSDVSTFPHKIPFEIGASRFASGDTIEILEIRGTAETFEPGNSYWIKGTYTLASRDRAKLSAFTTAKHAADAKSSVQSIQTVNVGRGTGEFTLILPMRHEGWPHVSFYPAGGGNGFGGIYFGTGDSVLKKWWDSKDDQQSISAESPNQSSAATDKSALRYDGKTFDMWQNAWQTELSTEKRLAAIQALAAFGANGYGREAAEAILDVASQYEWTSTEGSGKIRDLKEACLDAFSGRLGADALSQDLPPDDALAVLLAGAEAEDAATRHFVTWGLARYAYEFPQALDALLKLSRDENEGVRTTAFKGLPHLVGKFATNEKLLARAKEGLASEDPDTQIAAIQKLNVQHWSMSPSRGGAGASQLYYVPELFPKLFSEDENVRRWARAAINAKSLQLQDAPQVVDELLKVLDDEHRRPDHMEAIRALAAMGPLAKVAIPKLQDAIVSDPPKRLVALAALQRIEDDKAFGQLLREALGQESQADLAPETVRAIQKEQQQLFP
jgi:BlaR1 peptidase M56/Protein of unknown function (DUF1559)